MNATITTREAHPGPEPPPVLAIARGVTIAAIGWFTEADARMNATFEAADEAAESLEDQPYEAKARGDSWLNLTTDARFLARDHLVHTIANWRPNHAGRGVLFGGKLYLAVPRLDADGCDLHVVSVHDWVDLDGSVSEVTQWDRVAS